MSSKADERAGATQAAAKPHTFRYRAVSADGEIVEGEMEATDESAVMAVLEARGYLPVRAVAVAHSARRTRGRRAKTARGRASAGDAPVLARDLAQLTKAGVAVERALEILIDSAATPRQAALYTQVLAGIRAGSPLSETLERLGAPFDALFASLVKAGEAGGALPAVLAQLAEHLERLRELRARLRAALTYPAILLAVSALSVAFLLVYVVPQFRALLDGSEAALPLATRTVFAAADAVARSWREGVAVGVVLAGVAWLALRSERVRRAVDRQILKAPLIGPIVTATETARLCRSLGTLLANGVAILPSLAIVEGVCRNRAMAGVVGVLSEALRGGAPLGATLRRHREVPLQVAQMITVGEEGGRLPTMLLEVAKLQEESVRSRIHTLLALLEPLLILTMGVIVGAIIISILVAVLAVNRLAL